MQISGHQQRIQRRNMRGFTIIELMVSIALIGVLAAIAIPSYENYLKTTRTGVASSNAESLAAFVDTYFYENDTYLAGTYNPGVTDTLTTKLSWTPSGDKDQYIYAIVAGSTGDIATSYKITVSYKADTSIKAEVSRP